MEKSYFVYNTIIFIFGSLLVYVTSEMLKNQSRLRHLARSFEELDEQAKLIVKTDLELNKAQDELDKRLNGLDVLQQISRHISTSFDENEIFDLLSSPELTKLGFESYLVFLFRENDHLECKFNFGYPKSEVFGLIPRIKNHPEVFDPLRQGVVISSLTTNSALRETLKKIFSKSHHYILAPLLAQKNMLGFIFAGNQSSEFSITEGDEELISILGAQIAQSIENARLFEQVHRSSQMLEIKVQERTRQLTKALEDVEKVSKMKSEFISAVSHELRTPLTSIKGYASILITGKIGEIPDKVKERLERINRQSDNLVKLINDLLDISRIEAGKTEMKFEKKNIGILIDNVEDLLIPQMKGKNIRFIKDYVDEPHPVYVDASQIERVFINLVGNAIKFTPDGGAISVRVKNEHNNLLVTVSDTGIGIKKEEMENLFHEFYRVENEINQNVKGSGLGLALAKKIIEAHQGKMWVTSELNKGAHFHFTLPVNDPASSPEPG